MSGICMIGSLYTNIIGIRYNKDIYSVSFDWYE